MSLQTSTWGSLRHPRFRALWRSGGIYFIGNAMQMMATAWMVVELTGSSLLAALVQTAVFLPMFLLSLPAGVLADITDRRRLIVMALSVQAATIALLAVLLLAGVAGPVALLFFTGDEFDPGGTSLSPGAARRCCRPHGTRRSPIRSRAKNSPRRSRRWRSPTTWRGPSVRRWLV